jgi:DNA-binding IclR family transcriptional regulator
VNVRRSAGKADKASYEVNAVVRVLGLLECLSRDGRRRSLDELAAATGIPRATTFRLLRTLQQRGYVQRSEDGYALGFRCFLLGAAAGSVLDVRTQALPHLVTLRDATGETVQVAVLEEWRVVYLERVLSQRPVAYMKSRAGAILPAHCTGLGKALLAHRPPEEVAAWYRREGLPRFTPSTITSVEALLAELEAVRRRGYAIDEQERELGVRCIAAPIRDATGAVVAAVSVAAPGERLPAQLAGSAVAAQVVACAAGISRHLGYVPP